MKNVCVSLSQHFLRTWSCNNTVRKHQITMVLWQYLISIQCTIGMCDPIFNSDYLIFTWCEPNGSHRLNPLGLKVFGSQNIMMKILWKRQNSTGNFPFKKFRVSKLSPWPWVSPSRFKYHQLFPSKYWCQTGFIKWITMTKGIWNIMHSFQATVYPTVSQLNKCLKFKSDWGIKMTVFYTK